MPKFSSFLMIAISICIATPNPAESHRHWHHHHQNHPQITNFHHGFRRQHWRHQPQQHQSQQFQQYQSQAQIPPNPVFAHRPENFHHTVQQHLIKRFPGNGRGHHHNHRHHHHGHRHHQHQQQQGNVQNNYHQFNRNCRYHGGRPNYPGGISSHTGYPQRPVIETVNVNSPQCGPNGCLVYTTSETPPYSNLPGNVNENDEQKPVSSSEASQGMNKDEDCGKLDCWNAGTTTIAVDKSNDEKDRLDSDGVNEDQIEEKCSQNNCKDSEITTSTEKLNTYLDPTDKLKDKQDHLDFDGKKQRPTEEEQCNGKNCEFLESTTVIGTDDNKQKEYIETVDKLKEEQDHSLLDNKEEDQNEEKHCGQYGCVAYESTTVKLPVDKKLNQYFEAIDKLKEDQDRLFPDIKKQSQSEAKNCGQYGCIAAESTTIKQSVDSERKQYFDAIDKLKEEHDRLFPDTKEQDQNERQLGGIAAAIKKQLVDAELNQYFDAVDKLKEEQDRIFFITKEQQQEEAQYGGIEAAIKKNIVDSELKVYFKTIDKLKEEKDNYILNTKKQNQNEAEQCKENNCIVPEHITVITSIDKNEQDQFDSVNQNPDQSELEQCSGNNCDISGSTTNATPESNVLEPHLEDTSETIEEETKLNDNREKKNENGDIVEPVSHKEDSHETENVKKPIKENEEEHVEEYLKIIAPKHIDVRFVPVE